MAFGIEVDQDLRAWESRLKRFLDAVHPVMRVADGPVAGNPDVELHEMMRSAGARAQVVEAGKLGIIARRREKLRALFLGPFAVH